MKRLLAIIMTVGLTLPALVKLPPALAKDFWLCRGDALAFVRGVLINGYHDDTEGYVCDADHRQYRYLAADMVDDCITLWFDDETKLYSIDLSIEFQDAQS